MEPLYGRAQVIDQARALVDRGLAGEGRPLLFRGEPGIGKSLVMEHVAAEAAARQATVAWGRCWEAGGAPPYWPWIQVFRGLGMEEDPFAGAMASAAVAAVPVGDARFAMFDRAVRALQVRAAQTPVALILDDLHAADPSSLLLLLLLARQLRGTRTLVVGAYREAEARFAPEIAPLLAKIARESEVVPLGRLAVEDVGEWLRAAAGGRFDAGAAAHDDDAAAAELHRVTEGHPLFVVEALRLGRLAGPREGARLVVPAVGLATLLDEHLGRLSPGTRAVLEIAAVLGREFSTAAVAAAGEMGLDPVHAALTEASAASVVLPAADPGAFRFSHVLLRDRIYLELRPSLRAKLHLQAATAQLAQGAEGVTAAVHHLFEGQSAGSPERVAEVALAAAEASLSRLAFEDAARLARRALALGPAAGEGRLPGRLESGLRLVLAEALIRLGESAEGKAVSVQAADLAERAGARELLARAALVYGTELASGLIDPLMIGLLRRALAQLDDVDSPVRARLLIRLAAGLTPPDGPHSASEILGLTRAAIAMARRLGDPHVLLYVFQFAATVALLVHDDERFSFMRESVHLATALDQRLILLQALPSYITALLARGQPAEAQAMLPRYEEALEGSRQPVHRVHRAMLHALFAALRGDFDEAERHSAEARAAAERAGSDAGARQWLIQRLSFALLRGKPELFAPDAAQMLAQFGQVPSGAGYVAWTLLGIGRAEEAASRLRAVDLSAQEIPSANLMELLCAANVCVQVADTELGRTIYPRLVRATDRMFWNLGPGALIGPTARTLGDLALLIGRVTEAVHHYDEAIAFCERLGAPPLVDLCRRARDAAERSQTESSGAGALARTGAGPAAVMGGAVPARPAPRLQREGDLWAITATAPGQTLRLKHAKGLGYLRYLIDQGGRPVHVLELAGIDHRVGDAGVVLDARAKNEYRVRLDDLRDQLTEAEGFGDTPRVSRIEAEIGAIAEQLAGAVGLGGRDRRAASAVERTRINVQRCLKEAIERITSLDPALGRYLSATVKSGTYCVYQPL